MKAILEFGNGDSKKTFSTKEEVIEFLTDEQKAWQELFGAQNQGVLHTVKSEIHRQYTTTLQIANRITDETNFQNSLDQISNQYKQNNIIRFDGKRAKFIISLSNNDKVLALYLVGYFTKKIYSQNNDPIAFKAIFEGLKYDNGITSNIDSEKASLESLKTEWDEKLSKIQTTFMETDTNVNTTKTEVEKYLDDKKIEFDKVKEEREQEFNKLIKTYDDKLALQAPVAYWGKRSFWSYLQAGVLFAIFAIGISLVFYNFEPFAKDVASGIADKKYYPLIQFASITLVAIWFFRIIIKLFYSKLHLAEEATEKEMFIKTYLAMLRETDALKDESDRHLILQSIFSPSKNGIIKDDALPINIIENIVRART